MVRAAERVGRADEGELPFLQERDAIAQGKPIEVYNHGKMKRDFTYIDDVVEGIVRLLNFKPKAIADTANVNSKAHYKVYNMIPNIATAFVAGSIFW